MKNIIVFTLLFVALTGKAQKNDYFIVGTDTTFCSNFNYKTTAQSYLASISYINTDNEKVELKGRENIPDIWSFRMQGVIMDRIPQKTSKPDGYIKWAERVVDGKLIVNYYNSAMTTINGDGGSTTTSVQKFYVKMPDGTFYDINSKDFKTYIIPYLEKCRAFTSKYTEKYRRYYDYFIKMIEVYNSVCD